MKVAAHETYYKTVGTTNTDVHHGTHRLFLPPRSFFPQVERLTGLLSSQLEGVNATSGQGKAVFSWDRALTAAFPEAAKP